MADYNHNISLDDLALLHHDNYKLDAWENLFMYKSRDHLMNFDVEFDKTLFSILDLT